MSKLVYNPTRPKEPGADHFVLAYGMRGARTYLHHPAGFEHVSIDRNQLAQAWRGDRIAYRRGHYRYWATPRRVNAPSERGIYDAALTTFQGLYRQAEQCASGEGRLIGRAALLELAQLVSTNSISQQQHGHLVFFRAAARGKARAGLRRFLRSAPSNAAASETATSRRVRRVSVAHDAERRGERPRDNWKHWPTWRHRSKRRSYERSTDPSRSRACATPSRGFRKNQLGAADGSIAWGAQHVLACVQKTIPREESCAAAGRLRVFAYWACSSLP
jgi:hypothetical protein